MGYTMGSEADNKAQAKSWLNIQARAKLLYFKVVYNVVMSCMWLQYEYALWQLKRAEGWNAELFILGLQKES